MEYRCRWCDQPLAAENLECRECLERELQRRIGQRSNPEVLRPILDEVHTMIGFRMDFPFIVAYDYAIAQRRGILAARNELASRIGDLDLEDAPLSEETNHAQARSELLQAVLAYPYDYEESLKYASRAAARLFAWAGAKSIIPAGPSPAAVPQLRQGDGLLDWVQHRAWEAAWKAAFNETLKATEERLFSRFLTQLRNRIASPEAPARAA